MTGQINLNFRRRRLPCRPVLFQLISGILVRIRILVSTSSTGSLACPLRGPIISAWTEFKLLLESTEYNFEVHE
jgi:hypothetical protein